MAGKGATAWREWPVPLALMAYGFLVHRFWFLCDDAYITFRYAKNLARGYGVTFNVGEPPVEGYSDFGWLLLCAAFEALQWPVETLVPLVSSTMGGAFLVWFYARCRTFYGLDLPAAAGALFGLALSPAVSVWATSGLEPMPFLVFTFLCFEGMAFGLGRWAIAGTCLAALGLAFVRTEGVAWVGVVSVLALLARLVDQRRPTSRNTLLPVFIPLAVLGAVYLLYTLWRVNHFGEWLPNTAHAKVGFTLERLMRGIKYALLFQLTVATTTVFWLGTPAALRWRRGAGLGIFLLSIGFPVYGIVVGGDFFPMGRMIVPSIPFAALLFGFWLQSVASWVPRGGAWAAAALSVLVVGPEVAASWDFHVVPHSIREKLHFRLSDKEFLSEWARWDNMVGNTDGFSKRGVALRQYLHHEARVVSQAIGVIGYYSDLYLYDQYGLVDREVAMLPTPEGPLVHSPGHDKFVDATFFAKYEPEVLHSRVVQGALASRLMKDTMDKWAVPEEFQDRYVPDFVEMDLPGEEERSFLLLVRRAREGENPRQMWDRFPDRRKELLATFKGATDEGGPVAARRGDDES